MTNSDDQQSRYWLTPEGHRVAAGMPRGVVRAADLAERHMARSVRIGAIEGSLVGLIHSLSHVDVVLIVGGARAIFQLDLEAHVEVAPKSSKEIR